MLPSQDHKRHMDGDAGANTGGMGAYCPCRLITESDLATVTETVLQKAVNGMKMERAPFVGKVFCFSLTSRSIKFKTKWTVFTKHQ
jgi:phosphoribosylamine-glycine ligase